MVIINISKLTIEREEIINTYRQRIEREDN